MSNIDNPELSAEDFESHCQGKQIYQYGTTLFCFENGEACTVTDGYSGESITVTEVSDWMLTLFEFVKNNSAYFRYPGSNTTTIFDAKTGEYSMLFGGQEIPKGVETTAVEAEVGYELREKLANRNKLIKRLLDVSKTEWYDSVKAFIEKNEDTLLDSNGRLYPDRLSHCPELQEHTDTHIFTKMKDLLRTGKHSTLEFFRTQYPALLFDQVERDLKSDYSHDIQNETLANEIGTTQIEMNRAFFLARMDLIIDDRIDAHIRAGDIKRYREELGLSKGELRLAGDKVLSHFPPGTEPEDMLSKHEDYAVERTDENAQVHDSAVRTLMKKNVDLVIKNLNAD